MPMNVVVIGGPPGAGKTTLSRGLAVKLGYSSLTFDDVATGIRAVTTRETHPAFHLMTEGHLAYFTTGPPDKLIADALLLEQAIWPAVERLIRARLRGEQGIVIDYWLLAPAQVAELEPVGVQSFWLHIDPQTLDRRERSNTAFREGSDDPDRMHANYMARSLWRNQLIADEAIRLDLTLLHQTGNVTREALVDQALQLLT